MLKVASSFLAKMRELEKVFFFFFLKKKKKKSGALECAPAEWDGNPGAHDENSLFRQAAKQSTGVNVRESVRVGVK